MAACETSTMRAMSRGANVAAVAVPTDDATAAPRIQATLRKAVTVRLLDLYLQLKVQVDRQRVVERVVVAVRWNERLREIRVERDPVRRPVARAGTVVIVADVKDVWRIAADRRAWRVLTRPRRARTAKALIHEIRNRQVARNLGVEIVVQL